MRNFYTAILLLSCFISFSQEKKLREYSHTDFLKMIASEKDSVFKLKDAFITFTEKDSIFAYGNVEGDIKFTSNDTIEINKKIDLFNVHFEHQRLDEKGQGFTYFVFNKDVRIYDTTSLVFFNCIFKGNLEMDTSVLGNDQINKFEKKYPNYGSDIGFFNCTFYKNTNIDIGSIEYYSSIHFYFFYSNFISNSELSMVELYTNSIKDTHIDENIFNGSGYLKIGVDNSSFTSIYGNDFGTYRVDLSKESFNSSQIYIVEKNIFNSPFLLHINEFSIHNVYRWKQWKGKVLSAGGYDQYLKYLIGKNNQLDYDDLYKSDTVFNNYKNKYKIELTDSYKFEMQQLGQFYDFYKLQHDSDYANQVYIEFKDLETKRYAFLHKKEPSFNSFFTWKINQFLKMFSGYGTNPSLSIIFSLYVILVFAFVYMLFPNSWETGKKNKLMNRLRFFTKYFRQKEGIKEIYEEEQQDVVMSYTEFKKYMHSSKKEIPSYFLWLTKPIYYFSSYNYKMKGRILQHTDILKGRWVDLPKRRKIFTSLVIASWIIGLIIVDVVIKFFNALMLSINTFTTLGFGEIPIKGIPRYLAIIQGSIGWFMLTIFSVSLISQLLN
ncbi:MAG: two pore domain potassium channel family protein [Flavobacteriaceae bacterium]